MKHYQDCFQKILAYTTDSQWRMMRERKFSEFLHLDFPRGDCENWKYTDVSPIRESDFQLPGQEAGLIDVKPYFLKNSHSLVFINGYYREELSNVHLPEKVVLLELNKAWHTYSNLLKSYFEKKACGFNLLNAAFMTSGIFLYVPRDVHIDAPIQMLFLSNQPETMQHTRHVILVEENSQVQLIEQYIGLTDQKYFNNAVTMIDVHKNSKMRYYKLQQENSKAYHIGETLINQAENSDVKTYYFSSGAKLSREDLSIALHGQGAFCQLNGLYFPADNQHMDHHTFVDHLASGTSSDECYKGILSDKSVAVFNGKIRVNSNIKQINANQSNKNLLLSEKAEVNTKPELEIYADDVKCAHGATVGQLDEEALFYLRARGIDKRIAMEILTSAFAEDVFERIENEKIREWVKKEVETK